MWLRDGEALLASAAYFGLSDGEARRRYDDITRTVAGNWQKTASDNALTHEDMDRFAPVFEP